VLPYHIGNLTLGLLVLRHWVHTSPCSEQRTERRGVFIRFSLTNFICVEITGLRNPTYSFLCGWPIPNAVKHPEGLTRYYHCSFDALAQSEKWWGRFHLTFALHVTFLTQNTTIFERMSRARTSYCVCMWGGGGGVACWKV
jgi:hypothetical protein